MISAVIPVRVLSRRVRRSGSVAHIQMAATPAQIADLTAVLCAVTPIPPY